MRNKIDAGALVIGLASIGGMAAFVVPAIGQLTSDTRLAGLPGSTQLGAAILVLLCLVTILLEAQGTRLNVKLVALLGILVGVTGVLRVAEALVPGPGGFSPIFVPIIIAGYIFGARFGFLMGALSLFASALLSGGIGPWLPYQMLAAGWVGLTAGWLPQQVARRTRIIMLAAFGVLWGLGFGALMNLYFWPFMSMPATGESIGATASTMNTSTYLTFYIATSLWWDAARAVGNLLLILAFGGPLLDAFERYSGKIRFSQI